MVFIACFSNFLGNGFLTQCHSTEQLHYKERLASHLTSEEAEWNLVQVAFRGEVPSSDERRGQPEAREATQKLKEKARKKLLEVKKLSCSLNVLLNTISTVC